jgi:hypothetical protein
VGLLDEMLIVDKIGFDEDFWNQGLMKEIGCFS